METLPTTAPTHTAQVRALADDDDFTEQWRFGELDHPLSPVETAALFHLMNQELGQLLDQIGELERKLA